MTWHLLPKRLYKKHGITHRWGIERGGCPNVKLSARGSTSSLVPEPSGVEESVTRDPTTRAASSPLKF